jgi:superfamily I DNA/RNA helicase
MQYKIFLLKQLNILILKGQANMILHLDFNDWFAGNSEPVHITKKEMAEVPSPGSDWGYSHSSEYKGRPTKNQWTKKGQRATPAFTTPEELFDPHRPHSGYSKAAYYQNKPTGHEDNGGLDSPEPTATTPEPQPPQPARPKTSDRPPWVLAKAKVDETLLDHNGENHKIRKGQHVALKDNGDKTWAYATIWKGKLQWHNAHMSPKDLSGRFASVKGEDGNPIRGMKASELAASVHTEEAGEFTPTDEQQDIADTFEQNVKDGKNNHMVINARAGTGKTTTLKQLAKMYSAGQNWLYLVFNSKNQQEASKEFPKSVNVRTANSFGGQVIKENPTVIPHGQKRMAEIGGKGSNARLQQLTKGPQKDRNGSWNASVYDDEVLGQLNMSKPIYELDNNESKKYARKVKRKFNDIVMDVVGKAKGYGIMPSHLKSQDSEHDIEEVMQLHMFDSEMDKIKEAIRADENARIIARDLSSYYEVDDFLSYDFEKKIIQAAEWLLDKSAPGRHSEKFDQPSYDKKELLDIFAPDGQWNPNVDKKFSNQVDRMRYSPRNSRGNDRISNWDWRLKKAFETANQDQTQHSAKGFRDFDDDVWYLTQHADELRWPKYDVVLVDEVQDFNRAQKVMLSHLIKAGARVVAVGDPQQGIYRFRGGDHKAFGDISQMLTDQSEEPDKVSKTLTKNWRSKPGVIDRANRVSEEGGLKGDLQAGIEYDIDDPAHTTDKTHKVAKALDMLGKEYQSLGELKKETAFISRNNQPLISAATQLIKKGIPFQVQGIDLGKEIKNLIDDVALVSNLEDDSNFRDFEKSFDDYAREKREELSKADVSVKEEFQEFETNSEAILNSISTYKESEGEGKGKTVKDFKAWMGKRLGGDGEGITLTTAHKSKGLEFDRVYDIAPSLYGSSPQLKKARDKMEAADHRVDAFERTHPDGERTSDQEQEYKRLAKKAKNYRTRYEGDAVQENHAEYVVGTRGRHEHHALDDTVDKEE